jgi:CDP-glycerol glycerophosphotransferase (TagB/SpsB family)
LTVFEYRLASALLRVLGFLFRRLPIRPSRIVLATARLPHLEGNLAFIHAALRRSRPDVRPVLLLEPYSYGLRGKLGYLLRLIRGTFYVSSARLVVVDNAYLPLHVAPHRRATTVVQVWHAVGALKRFGLDAPLAEPERTFLHRYYDNVVVSSEATRGPVSTALRTPVEKVLALGTPRTDFFFDTEALAAARAHALDAYPELAGRKVVLHAPTFRGRGRHRRAASDLDAVELRKLLPDPYVLALKGHPNLDPDATERAGYDVVIDPDYELNSLLAATDILITDYSSSIFEWALLRRPLILLVPDLVDYERDPGLYLDYRHEMIGAQVETTAEVAALIRAGDFDTSGYDAFIARHLGSCDGHASERFIDHFLGRAGGVEPAAE